LRFGLVGLVLGSIGLLLGPQPVRSADSPRWGGRDDSNMVSDEKGLPESFVPGKKRSDGSGIDLATTENVKWVARLGSQTYGTPTVAGGRVFVGCNDEAMQDPKFRPTRGGAVKCFDEATGKLLWELAIPRKEIHDPTFNFDDMGLASAPRRPSTAIGSTWSPTAARCFAWTSTARPTATTVRSWTKGSTWPARASRRSRWAPPTATSSGVTT
jgi:hypothetical protein